MERKDLKRKQDAEKEATTPSKSPKAVKAASGASPPATGFSTGAAASVAPLLSDTHSTLPLPPKDEELLDLASGGADKSEKYLEDTVKHGWYVFSQFLRTEEGMGVVVQKKVTDLFLSLIHI